MDAIVAQTALRLNPSLVAWWWCFCEGQWYLWPSSFQKGDFYGLSDSRDNPPPNPTFWNGPLPTRYSALTSMQRRAVRHQYIANQGGRCSFCNRMLAHSAITKHTINRELFPKGFFNSPIHLHHDHKTGMTIGAVHAYCNAVLWQYYGE